jgi:hypothetical protein
VTFVAGLAAAGCGHTKPPPVAAAPVPVPVRRELAVIPAESDAFPAAARAISAQLAQARVAGIDETRLSKVPLEVVQLAIECVEPTGTCYEAIGKSLAANQLLFARIAVAAGKSKARRPLKVTVTLFDVDARAAARTAEREFATEADATAGAAALVEEVTR